MKNFSGYDILINTRIANDDSLTVEKCLELCKYEKYAAIGKGVNCFCGDEFRRIEELPASDCDMKCSGDETQICGGSLKLTIFNVESPRKFTGQCLKAESDIIKPLWKEIGSSLSLDFCLDQCKNFKYAALGNGKNCFCVENLAKITLQPDSECNIRCGADPDISCGGPYRWNTYTIEKPEPFTGQCMQEKG